MQQQAAIMAAGQQADGQPVSVQAHLPQPTASVDVAASHAHAPGSEKRASELSTQGAEDETHDENAEVEEKKGSQGDLHRDETKDDVKESKTQSESEREVETQPRETETAKSDVEETETTKEKESNIASEVRKESSAKFETSDENESKIEDLKENKKIQCEVKSVDTTTPTIESESGNDATEATSGSEAKESDPSPETRPQGRDEPESQSEIKPESQSVSETDEEEKSENTDAFRTTSVGEQATEIPVSSTEDDKTQSEATQSNLVLDCALPGTSGSVDDQSQSVAVETSVQPIVTYKAAPVMYINKEEETTTDKEETEEVEVSATNDQQQEGQAEASEQQDEATESEEQQAAQEQQQEELQQQMDQVFNTPQNYEQCRMQVLFCFLCHSRCTA